MARTDVATEQVTRAGLVLEPTAPTADGDVVEPGATLYVVNSSAGSIDVEVEATVSVDGLDVADLVTAVPAGATSLIGPLPKSTFARDVEPDKGKVYVNYSAQASVTRAVVSL